jgi:hypothetical protein
MILMKEVLHRLLLAKAILGPTRNVVRGELNPHLVARQVLNSHDAADLVFAAIADHQGKLPAKSKSPSMLQCLDLIRGSINTPDAYFNGLNDARNSLKHAGNLPNTSQWANVGEETFERLSSACQAALGVALDDVDELELVQSAVVKDHLFAAKQLAALRQFKAALQEIGKALSVGLQENSDLWRIAVGRPKAEDALKLTAFGISANRFLRLQEFLPCVSVYLSQTFRITWTQSKLGHPGNWRADAVEFCLKACLEVILGTQTASEIPLALELRYLYDYRITAKEDNVEVWEDLVDGHLDDFVAGDPRPFKERKRYMKAGESIIVPAMIEPLVSDDLSLEGDEIKRVRISGNSSSLLFPPTRAEYVDLGDVQITCIPHKSHAFPEGFHGLPETPWQEDPPEE